LTQRRRRASIVPADTTLTVLPLTPGRWPDLETIFNATGCAVARGCWCMYSVGLKPREGQHKAG